MKRRRGRTTNLLITVSPDPKNLIVMRSALRRVEERPHDNGWCLSLKEKDAGNQT